MPPIPRRALLSLPPGVTGLHRGVPPVAPAARPAPDPADVLYVLAADGGVRVDPGAPEFRADRPVRVGRNQLEVDVYLAPGDAEVARVQAVLGFDGAAWWLRNQGPLPLRLPARELAAGQAAALPRGYTSVHLETRGGRQYLVEVRVTRDREPPAPPPVAADAEAHLATADVSPRRLRLSPVDRLVLVVLARRYLALEAHPAPLPWAQVALELSDVAPDRAWSSRVVENRVRRVRDELSRDGVPGLRAEELEPPIGNQINHNLVLWLMAGRTIRPSDLVELGLAD